MDTSEFTFKEWAEIYQFAETYRTTKEDVANFLIKKNFEISVYSINVNKEKIYIDNMMWYYLGLFECGTLIRKMPFVEHPKTIQLLENLNSPS